MKYGLKGGLILALFALMGCENGRQAAVLSMDEARLNIATAEKLGAETLAGPTFAQAKMLMTRAEERFRAKAFGEASTAAAQANRVSMDAASEARNAKAKAVVTKKTVPVKNKSAKPSTNPNEVKNKKR